MVVCVFLGAIRSDYLNFSTSVSGNARTCSVCEFTCDCKDIAGALSVKYIIYIRIIIFNGL